MTTGKRDQMRALEGSGVYVPKYQPPKQAPVPAGPFRTYDQQPIEVRQIDEPFPTIPAAPFAWLTLVSEERAIWSSQKPWAAVDVYVYSPVWLLQVVIRVYAIVGDTRTLVASGRTGGTPLQDVVPQWVASATQNVERWEVTRQVWAYDFKPGLSTDRLRYSVLAYGKEPGGDRTALGGVCVSQPPLFTEAGPAPAPDWAVSQGVVGRDRVRLVHVHGFNGGADTFVHLYDAANVPIVPGPDILRYTFFVPANQQFSFTPPSISEDYFRQGLVWSAWTGPVDFGPFAGAHDAAAVVFPVFHIR